MIWLLDQAISSSIRSTTRPVEVEFVVTRIHNDCNEETRFDVGLGNEQTSSIRSTTRFRDSNYLLLLLFVGSISDLLFVMFYVSTGQLLSPR
mmetsp:Transcript_19417/g.19762  ORF Transcript_19417/g.19762 Transcript_19417/m.19762 type:complete len:92 (-) Transcript_19417:2-277(-)